MARCWTCGSKVTGFSFTCSVCKNSRELQAVQDVIAESHGEISEQVSNLDHSLQRRFDELSDTISTGFSVMASVMVWGVQEVTWRLEQQTRILRNIDQTLVSIDKSERYRRRTEANELREQADDLRWKGVLDKAEEFYLEALRLNPSDFEIYMGLADTYLKINQVDKAESALEKSLPHALKRQEFNDKSRSLLLIGKICACREDFERAAETLRQAVELSPTWPDAHYDYAQYCAQLANTKECLASLEKAVASKPLLWSLAKHERTFEPARRDVDELLSRIQTETFRPADGIMREVASAYELVRQVISPSNLNRIAPTLEGDMQRLKLLQRMRNVFRFRELMEGFPWLLSRLEQAVQKRLATVELQRTDLRAELAESKRQLDQFSEEAWKWVLGFGIGSYILPLAIFMEYTPSFYVSFRSFLLYVLLVLPALVVGFGYKFFDGQRKNMFEAKARLASFENDRFLPLKNLLEKLESLISQLEAKQKDLIRACD